MTERTFVMQPMQCPVCAAPQDRVAPGFEPKAVPGPGDLVVCIRCAAFNTFDPQMQLVAMTDEQVAALPDESRNELLRMRRAIKTVQSFASER